MTDAKIKAEFEKMNAKPKQEVSARHVLVREEDKAKELISKAMKGESFEDLAKECSECPSKSQGGSLGFFARESMDRSFGNVAFAIARTITKARAEADKKGMTDKSVDALIKAKLLKKEDLISRKPVKSAYGWHLIKVEDVREKEKPKFDDQMRDKIKRKLVQKFVRKHVLSLRDKAQIKMHFPKAAEAQKADKAES
jgi:peptidyl-prolyl cis-trans isomerase C